MRVKRTKKKFDQIKVVLPLKFRSLGCTWVILRSETFLYMSAPQYPTPFPLPFPQSSSWFSFLRISAWERVFGRFQLESRHETTRFGGHLFRLRTNTGHQHHHRSILGYDADNEIPSRWVVRSTGDEDLLDEEEEEGVRTTCKTWISKLMRAI